MRDACGGRLAEPEQPKREASEPSPAFPCVRQTLTLAWRAWEDCSIEVGVMQSTSIALHRVGLHQFLLGLPLPACSLPHGAVQPGSTGAHKLSFATDPS